MNGLSIDNNLFFINGDLLLTYDAVSYTHLDVYKRQVYRTLKTMRRHYPHIDYKRVLAYLPTALEQGDKAEQADTLIPAGIELSLIHI